MRKIISHLKENWIRYGFETAVVTISILGAFGLNSWYESRKVEKIELQLLSEMRDDLKSDLRTLNYNIVIHNAGKLACETILYAMEDNLPYHDSLSQYFAMTHNYTVFEPNDGAYESLKSLGLEMIQNDQIRKNATLLYDQRYKTLQANTKDITADVLSLKRGFNSTIFEEFMLFDFSHVNPKKGSYGGTMAPLNFENIKTNQQYLYYLKSLRNAHAGIIPPNTWIKNDVESLIEILEAEIQARIN